MATLAFLRQQRNFHVTFVAGLTKCPVWRCPDGLSFEGQVKGCLKEMDEGSRAIEGEIPAVRRVQRDSRVKDTATQKSQRGGRNRFGDR